VLDQGDGIHAVAGEVEEALNVSEREMVGDYCRWLARREEEEFDGLVEAHELLHQRQQEIVALHSGLAELQGRHQELALALDRIVHGNTWRLRTLVLRLIRGAGDVFARAATAIRGRA
jgi:hypothetical protein